MIYLISVMCTKLAILMLYVQVFRVKTRFRYLCFAMVAVVCLSCTILFFIEAFNCNPVKEWYVLTYTEYYTCFDNNMVEFVIGGFNIGTDLFMLLMSIPLILGLQVDSRRKLGLLVIFSTRVL